MWQLLAFTGTAVATIAIALLSLDPDGVFLLMTSAALIAAFVLLGLSWGRFRQAKSE